MEMDSETETVGITPEKQEELSGRFEGSEGSDSSVGSDAESEKYTERGTLEYLWQTGRVLREKTWSSLWKFDMFSKVDRIYPKESYYGGMWGITSSGASRIIDDIWIGSAFNAADYKWLKGEEIDLIVNITGDISNYYPNDFAYVNYKTEDLDSGQVSEFLDDFVQLVNLNPERRILVHCFAGKSRSASLVLYYLIKEKQMTFDDALEYLKVRRPCININCRFLEEIKERIHVVM